MIVKMYLLSFRVCVPFIRRFLHFSGKSFSPYFSIFVLFVLGGASGMGVDGIGKIGDRASEGQATGVYRAGFTAGSLAGKGARAGTRGMGNFIIQYFLFHVLCFVLLASPLIIFFICDFSLFNLCLFFYEANQACWSRSWRNSSKSTLSSRTSTAGCRNMAESTQQQMGGRNNCMQCWAKVSPQLYHFNLANQDEYLTILFTLFELLAYVLK